MADVQGFLGHGSSSGGASSGASGFLNYAPPRVSAPVAPPANLDKYQTYYKTLAPDERQNFLDSLIRGARRTGDTSKLALYNNLKGDTSPQTDVQKPDLITTLTNVRSSLPQIAGDLAKGVLEPFAHIGNVASEALSGGRYYNTLASNAGANIATAGQSTDQAIRDARAGNIPQSALSQRLLANDKVNQAATTSIASQVRTPKQAAGDVAQAGLILASGGESALAKAAQATFLVQQAHGLLKNAPQAGQIIFDPTQPASTRIQTAISTGLGVTLLAIGAKQGAEGISKALDVTPEKAALTLELLRQNEDAIKASLPPDTRPMGLPEGNTTKALGQGELQTPGGGVLVENRPTAPPAEPTAAEQRIATIDKQLKTYVAGKGKLDPQAAADLMRERTRLTAGGTETPITPGNPSVAQSTTPVEGSTTLQSSVIPGAAEFAQHDVVPAAQGAVKAVKEVKDAIAPTAASPEARRSADIVAKAHAEIANTSSIEGIQGRLANRFFGKLSNDEGVANISNYERTGEFAKAPKGYSDTFKQSMDAAHAVMRQVYGDGLGYVENYVRRQFKFGSAADEAQGTAVLSDLQKTLAASKSPTRGRTLDMPLDEALQAMRERGIKVEPATTNPEALRQWTVANAQRAQSFANAWGTLKQEGLIQFSKSGDHPPDGMVALNDRAAQGFFPSETGATQAGRYFASPEVARILNNTISSGFEDSIGVRGLRTVSNQMNMLQLGLSGFHLTGTAINAGVSQLAVGLRELGHGNLLTGAKDVSTSFVPFYSFAKDLKGGDSFLKGLADSSPEAYKLMEEKLNPGGGRLGLDEKYRLRSYENMMTAAKQGNYLGAGLRLPSALVQAVAHPLMNYAIPRVKLGAYFELANAALDRLPEGASQVTRERALSQAWDSVDNRFGQIAYDKLFWNKTMKDMALITTRSVGWNLGTLRELGGGAFDLTKTAQGKGVTDRTLYAVALPLYVGTLGAVYQYLHTGKAPSKPLDYFYPKNGLTDKNGNPDRTTLPTYMKDIFAYGKAPFTTIGHKSSPLLSLAISLGTNRNYFGDMVRNPDDPKGTQLKQAGLYALSQLTPFSISQGQRSLKEGGPVQATENLFGFTKAPGSITQTGFEQKTYDALTKQIGGAARTPEQVQLATAKTQARDAAGKGNPNLVDQLMQSSQISPTTAKQLKADANMTSLQRAFRALDYVNQDKLLQSANPDDIKKLGDLGDIRTRAQKASKNKNASGATRQAATRVANRLR